MICVQFNDLDEFLTELETEATSAHGDVERGIVRFTSRLHDTGIPGLMVQRVSFVAGFIAVDGRLVEIIAPCGGYQLQPTSDEEQAAQVADRAKALESSLVAVCERLGLETRNGAFRIVT